MENPVEIVEKFSTKPVENWCEKGKMWKTLWKMWESFVEKVFHKACGKPCGKLKLILSQEQQGKDKRAKACGTCESANKSCNDFFHTPVYPLSIKAL